MARNVPASERIKGYRYDGLPRLFFSHRNFQQEHDEKMMCPISGDSIDCVDLKEVAHAIGRELEYHFDVWKDTDITKSDALHIDHHIPTMNKAIEQADLFVAVIPEGDHSKSFMISDECKKARQQGKPTFHIYLGDATTDRYKGMACSGSCRLEYKDRDWECGGSRWWKQAVVQSVKDWAGTN
ncbi:MAG: hypothetical protein JW839_00090 [Candidatus Lokiarchaeota archaeon]|nr:hypothetical protein [Candidatus Lokiarchaeota archaeon]